MTVLALVLVGGLTAAAEPSQCPAGMVLVKGSGTLGMRGNPYGVVPTAHLEVVDAPERGCPDAVAAVNGASVCWVQTDLVDPVVPVRAVKVEPFCIERFPFPGRAKPYTTDGLSVWDAHQLRALLDTGRYGHRRMCTYTEFQAAVAGLAENRRFVFGDEYINGVCEGDTVGADSRCRNTTTGVADYGGVHSHWVVADPEFVAGACNAPPCRGAGNRALTAGQLIVAGGTNRAQTRQAPFTPHTWHDHGEPTKDACGFHGWDDQPVICSTPGEYTQTQRDQWAAFRRDALSTGSMRQAISKAVGRPICD